MSRSCHSGWFSSAVPGVAAEHARETRHALREDRVALVGHRRRALLALLERLLDLADLGVLEVPDLGREPLQAPAEDRDRRQERRVPVALDDLGARRVDRQAELGHDLGLDLGLEVAVRPDRAGQLAGRDLVDRLREAAPAAIDLERPARRASARTSSARRGPSGSGPSSRVSASARARVHERLERAGRRRAAAARRPRAAAGRAPCRRRRTTSGRGGGSGPPARSTRRPGTRRR